LCLETELFRLSFIIGIFVNHFNNWAWLRITLSMLRTICLTQNQPVVLWTTSLLQSLILLTRQCFSSLIFINSMEITLQLPWISTNRAKIFFLIEFNSGRVKQRYGIRLYSVIHAVRDNWTQWVTER
jgi:hypothetical protein